MKSLRVRLLSSLTLTLLGACLSTGLASAQETTGKFTLPFEARWGLATLPAGDYSFKVDAASGGALHLFRGTKTVALIYALCYDRKTSDRSALKVVGETARTIREMTLPNSGVVLYYAPHKPKHGSAPEERQIAAVIPITTAGAAQ